MLPGPFLYSFALDNVVVVMNLDVAEICFCVQLCIAESFVFDFVRLNYWNQNRIIEYSKI